MRTLIIIPTYNERENLPEMIARLEQLGLGIDLLVVDDNSPDGTGELAKTLAATRPWLQVMHRPGKAGLGTAYLDGFRLALTQGYDVVGQMDADLSHDPAYLPAMLEALDRADLVLGSRYRPGGGVKNWGPIRQIISRGGSLYSRLILGLSIRDLTGGFKLFHRRVLEGVDLDKIRSNGYCFQIEMTYRALRRGFRVAEVPIVFLDRRVGRSKLTRKVVMEAVLMIPWLRMQAFLGNL